MPIAGSPSSSPMTRQAASSRSSPVSTAFRNRSWPPFRARNAPTAVRSSSRSSYVAADTAAGVAVMLVLPTGQAASAQLADDGPAVGHPFVGRLAADVAGVQLAADHRGAPAAEGLVEVDVPDVEPCPGGVPVDHLRPRGQPERLQSPDRGGGVGVVRRPVVQQRAQVDQGIAERGHVPVEDRDDAVGVTRPELAVVDLEVVVQHRNPDRLRAPGRSGRRAPRTGSPSAANSRSPMAGRMASHRDRQPLSCRSTNPAGTPRPDSPQASASTRCRSARASTTDSPMRWPVSGPSASAPEPSARRRRRDGTRRRGTPSR